jgi:hypothetical protein
VDGASGHGAIDTVAKRFPGLERGLTQELVTALARREHVAPLPRVYARRITAEVQRRLLLGGAT